MNLTENIKQFENSNITRIKDILSEKDLTNLIEEARYLEGKAESLNIGHSRYLHVKPYVFNKNTAPWKDQEWRLLKLYHSEEFTSIIENIVGEKLNHMPVIDDPRFEINCKLNYYRFYPNSPNKTKLGWHYDRTDQVKGRVFVVVLTLENELDEYVLVNEDRPNIKANPDENVPILSYFPSDKPFTKESLYLSSNCITVHDPHKIFHRANPVDVNKILDPSIIKNHQEKTGREYFRRTIFVMKFTTDDTPKSFLASTLSKMNFGVRSVTGYVKTSPSVVIPIIISILLLISVVGIVALAKWRNLMKTR